MDKNLLAMFDLQIKKGMKFTLATNHPNAQAKKGDIVKVTSVTAMGYKSDGFMNDYENIRVSNAKFSWRVDRADLRIIK